MVTMKIVLNDFIEDIFPPSEMMKALDKICTDTNYIKIGEGEYLLKEDADSIGTLLVLLSRFEQQSWLFPNMKSWTILDDEEDAEPQNFLEIYKRRAIDAIA